MLCCCYHCLFLKGRICLDTNWMMKIEQHFIEQSADNMEVYGLSATVGRVLGIIQMNQMPMTLNELSDATGMSKTRMSQVVREMLELNVADKVFIKGSRQDVYDVEPDHYQNFISLFSVTWGRMVRKSRIAEKRMYQELIKMIQQGELTEEELEKVQQYAEQSKKLLAYYEWLSRLIEFFDSDEVFTHIPKIDENK